MVITSNKTKRQSSWAKIIHIRRNNTLGLHSIRNVLSKFFQTKQHTRALVIHEIPKNTPVYRRKDKRYFSVFAKVCDFNVLQNDVFKTFFKHSFNQWVSAGFKVKLVPWLCPPSSLDNLFQEIAYVSRLQIYTFETWKNRLKTFECIHVRNLAQFCLNGCGLVKRESCVSG